MHEYMEIYMKIIPIVHVYISYPCLCIPVPYICIFISIIFISMITISMHICSISCISISYHVFIAIMQINYSSVTNYLSKVWAIPSYHYCSFPQRPEEPRTVASPCGRERKHRPLPQFDEVATSPRHPTLSR